MVTNIGKQHIVNFQHFLIKTYKMFNINTLIRSSCFKFIVFSLILLVSVQSHAYEKIDEIIAIVGDHVIFSSDLKRKINQIKVRLRAQGEPNDFNDKILGERVLDSLIAARLQLNLAEKNHIIATDTEIDTALVKTKRGLEARGVAFEEYLSSQELTLNGARKELEEELIIEKIQQGVINQRTSVTEREIDNFLDSKAGKEWLTPRFHLGHILLKGDNTKTVLAHAKRIYKALQESPHQFKKLAEQYSRGPSASKGGDLGMQKKSDLPELFIQKIQTLKVGDITQPFKSNAGVHILQLFNRQGAEPVFVKQYKVKHILVKPTELFSEQEVIDEINVLYQRLISGESFPTLAQEHTDDIASKLKGGDLGWSTLQQFVPEFAKTVEDTPIGTISKPFKSPFGWHILVVEDQRIEDVFESAKRNQVTKILQRQRFNDELQIWLQELRDNTYVDILI
ncbi:hypothetical protein AB835_07170 [Candidatus Endobugula sertula]|uniref:Chaperone SurA n=1 Tax=Candidatus Endobugula sertula TaxID=62101 RepID=A0A1D2QQ90_9GAMM|nr:hypothetical protein AB835_07170 [Candidatus Endobugula sertula]